MKLKLIILIILVSIVYITIERKIKKSKKYDLNEELSDDDIQEIANEVPSFTTPKELREQLKDINYSETVVKDKLVPFVKLLDNTKGLAITVKNSKQMAKLEAEVNVKPEKPNMTDEERVNEVLGSYDVNKTSAVTLINDRFISLDKGEKFDKYHEFVHILTAPGGKSIGQKEILPLNEGLVNFWTIEIFKSMEEKIVDRYPFQTEFVKTIFKIFEKNNLDYLTLAFDATFHGKIHEFLSKLCEIIASSPKLLNGKNKPFSIKKLTSAELKPLIIHDIIENKWDALKGIYGIEVVKKK